MNYNDIIPLGRYSLMCGDCTNPEHVSRLMHNTHAALLFTSPPYSDMYTYGGTDLSPEHLASFIHNFKPHADIMAVNLGLKKRNHEIITYWDTYIKAAHDSGLKLLSWDVWDKLNPGSISQQQAMFPIRHEFIFVFGRKPRTLNKTIHKRGRKNDWRQFGNVREPDGSMKYTSRRNNPDEPMKRLETVITHHPQKARPVYQPAQMKATLLLTPSEAAARLS